MATTADVATTIVAVDGNQLREAEHAIPTTLAEIAARHELVIVYSQAAGPATAQDLLTSVRTLLPRWRVTAVFVDPPPRLADADVGLIDELLNEGALAVTVTSSDDPGPTAEALAIRLRADYAYRLLYDAEQGVRLLDLARPVPSSC